MARAGEIAKLAACLHGTLARACGIVTVRQRPGPANGTVFVSIEDGTGSINVTVWPSLVEKQRKVLLGPSLLTVYGGPAAPRWRRYRRLQRRERD